MVATAHIHVARKKNDRKLARCETVAAMYLRGESQQAIADKLDISLPTVRRDIEGCRKIWRENSLAAFETHLAESLAKIDAAESAAWIGWERSLKDETQTTTEESEGPNGATTRTRMRRRSQSGQAAFVTSITRLIELRCRLLGMLDKGAAEQSIATASFNVVSIVVDNREQAESLRVLTADQYQKKIEEAKSQQ